MDIACLNEDIVKDVTTHQELAPTNILSILANLTPFSDYNQSPRNMYQCQVNTYFFLYIYFHHLLDFVILYLFYIKMSKQTMGTPATALRYRTDNKLYR